MKIEKTALLPGSFLKKIERAKKDYERLNFKKKLIEEI